MEKIIKILYKREWKFNGGNGEEVHGWTYGGKVSTGGGITFTSRWGDYEKGDEVTVTLAEGWDEKRNQVKYSEIRV